MKNILYFLLLTFLSLGFVCPATRVRRQGITFSDDDDDGRFPTFNGGRPTNGGGFQFDDDRRPFGNGNGGQFNNGNGGQFNNGNGGQFNNGGRRPTNWNPSQRLRSTTSRTPAASGGTTTTTAAPAFRNCMSSCLTTPEYNPVCGSDGTTYTNEGRMRCANRCGASVVKVFGGTCQPQ